MKQHPTESSTLPQASAGKSTDRVIPVIDALAQSCDSGDNENEMNIRIGNEIDLAQ